MPNHGAERYQMGAEHLIKLLLNLGREQMASNRTVYAVKGFRIPYVPPN